MNTHPMKDELFKWTSNVNISYIIRFHEFVLSELERKEVELGQTIANFEGDRKAKVDLLVESDLYTTTYRHLLINNTFLVLYSHLEEWLYHIWKTYGNTIVLSSKSRGSISRFRPVLKHALNIDLSKDEKWQFVVEAEKIRDCLLHANARIDLFKDANKLKNLLRKRRDLLSEKRSRLYINQSYVEKFFECVQYIILRVESTQET